MTSQAIRLARRDGHNARTKFSDWSHRCLIITRVIMAVGPPDSLTRISVLVTFATGAILGASGMLTPGESSQGVSFQSRYIELGYRAAIERVWTTHRQYCADDLPYAQRKIPILVGPLAIGPSGL